MLCGKEARGFTGGDVLTEHAVLATFPRAQPGDINRRPCVISPYHYRMDWLMWFAAMGSYGQYPWLVLLVDRLLEGNPAVFPFFVTNPFPDPNAPPARTFLSEAWSSNDDAVKSQPTKHWIPSRSHKLQHALKSPASTVTPPVLSTLFFNNAPSVVPDGAILACAES